MNDNYELAFVGPDGTTTGNFYVTAVYQSNGLYLAEYVPQTAGKFVLSISLLGESIYQSPWTVTIEPGEVSPPLCITTLATMPMPLTFVAGMTKFFLINTFDVYGNRIYKSYKGTKVTIKAAYIDNLAYPSPLGLPDITNWAQIYGKDIAGISMDNGDGTYTGQITIYRAGKFSLSIMIDDLHVAGSPYELPSSDYYYITSSDIYAPLCLVNGLVTTFSAGVTSTFYIQGRDFYANNIPTLFAAAVTDYKVELRHPQTN